jgi:hypothetical protein
VLDVKRSSGSMTRLDRVKKYMKEEDRKKIEQLMGEIECPKDFKCVKENFDRLCQAGKFGIDEHLECLEKNPAHCPFAVSFINRHFCICQMRMYIVQKLKK